jgi:glyoxylase-like metal-dependent hydrolase (beta-lactamase superfamily II)
MNILEDNQIQKIADNIYLVMAPQKGQFPYCHGFLFTGSENILIDAGADEDLIRKIDSEIGIDSLVISHSHPDHIRRWFVLDHRKLILPAETPDTVYDLTDLGERFVGTRERGVRWADIIGKTLGLRPFRKPDGRFSHGHIFDTGTSRIEAIHAPGHLDDHYCFFEHNTGTLISTDIDFSSFGPWYGNPEGRIKPFIGSVRKIMSMPYSRVCTSHKLPHEGDATDRFNAYLQSFERQKNEILAFLGRGKTLHQIAEGSPFYKNKFMDTIIQYAFEEHMAAENLSILIEEGKVVEDGGVYLPARG